jgi:peroxiredoxin
MVLSRRHLAIAAALTAAAVAAALLPGGGSGRAPAPQVSYTLLDGSTLSTAQLTGQVVLVNFWATSCSTCVGEMPQITAAFETYRGRGYQTVAVAMQDDPPALVANFAESHHLPFGVAIDNTGAIARGFGQVHVTPTSFLINKRGEIVKRYVGAPDFAALHVLIAQLLAET